MKKLLFALIAATGLTLTSCSDFLEAKNKSNIDTDAYFTTEEGFENYSVYPYYLLRNIYGGAPNLFCSGTDLYEQGRSNYSINTTTDEISTTRLYRFDRNPKKYYAYGINGMLNIGYRF